MDKHTDAVGTGTDEESDVMGDGDEMDVDDVMGDGDEMDVDDVMGDDTSLHNHGHMHDADHQH